jgi:hypothetical protein
MFGRIFGATSYSTRHSLTFYMAIMQAGTQISTQDKTHANMLYTAKSRSGIAAERLRSPSVSARPRTGKASRLPREAYWSGSVDLPNCTQSTQSTQLLS